MFGIGTTELLVILVIALVVLGPKKLPEVARGLGRALGELRRAGQDLRDTIETEAFDPPRTGDRGGALTKPSGPPPGTTPAVATPPTPIDVTADAPADDAQDASDGDEPEPADRS